MLQARKYEGLNALPISYKEIFEEGSRQSFFLGLPWFRNFESTILGPQESALIYGIERNDLSNRPLAALVLRSQRAKRPKLSPSIFQGLANYYTSYFSPIISNECIDQAVVMDALADALVADGYLWDVCNLPSFNQDSYAFRGFIEAFRRLGMAGQTYFLFGNWYLAVMGQSYYEYLKTLSPIVRETIRRKGRKLEKNSDVRIQIITKLDDLSTAIEDYTKIYNASWKKPEPFPFFMPGLIRTCAEMGSLRLGMLYVNDALAAAQMWV